MRPFGCAVFRERFQLVVESVRGRDTLDFTLLRRTLAITAVCGNLFEKDFSGLFVRKGLRAGPNGAVVSGTNFDSAYAGGGPRGAAL